MAHRSRKKHLKHLRQHEPATPPARSPVAKAEAAARGIARGGGTQRLSPELDTATKKPGLVRRLATKATETLAEASKLVDKLPRRRDAAGMLATPRKLAAKLLPSKLAAKPKQALSRAKARVKARVSRSKPARAGT